MTGLFTPVPDRAVNRPSNSPCQWLPELHYVRRRATELNKLDSGSTSSLEGNEGMPDPGPRTCSEIHTRAICDEVGERLRFLLDRSETPVPQRLLALLLRLQLNELKERARAPNQASRASTAA
jgi:hypothetical protein